MSATDDLPPTLTVDQAAGLLGICRDAAYDLIRAERFPVTVLHLGRSIRVPTRPLLNLLGLDQGHVRHGPASAHPPPHERETAAVITAAVSTQQTHPEPDAIETEEDQCRR